MKSRKYETHLEIDEDGNPHIYNRQLFLNFCSEHPNQRMTAVFKKVGKDHSGKFRGYYFAEVVTKYQDALRSRGYKFTKDQTHKFIKQFSPTMQEEIEIDGSYFQRDRSFTDDDFDQSDFTEYVEDLIRFAAEEFSIIINNPGEYE